MTDIQFDEPQYAQPLVRRDKSSLLVRLMIRIGLADTDAQAQNTLLAIAIGFFILTAWIFLVSYKVPPPPVGVEDMML